MSNQLHEIKTEKGLLQVTEFLGPAPCGPMLQLTQGMAGTVIGQPGDLGAIQLTLAEVAAIVPLLVGWMRDECRRRADNLRVCASKLARINFNQNEQ